MFSSLQYHTCHQPLLPVKTDPANVKKKIKRRGGCCLWVTLMHLSSMPGHVFLFSGLLHDDKELRYLLLKTAKTHICYSPKMFPGTHSVAVKQLNASAGFVSGSRSSHSRRRWSTFAIFAFRNRNNQRPFKTREQYDAFYVPGHYCLPGRMLKPLTKRKPLINIIVCGSHC